MTDEELKQMEAKRRRRRLIIVLAVVLAVIALPTATWLAVHFYWKGKLEAAKDAIRASGQPVTWDEALEARNVPPDPENSALVLLEAFDALPPSGSVEEELADDWGSADGVAPSEEARAIVGGYIARNAEALALIEEATQLPGGAYPLDPAVSPFTVSMNYLSKLRETARLCTATAAWRAACGDDAGAVETLSYGPGLAASLNGSVTIIEVLVRIACDAVWLAGVQRVLALTELPADDLGRLRALVAREEEGFDPRAAFIGERAAGLMMFGDAGGRGAPTAMPPEAATFAKVRRLVPGWVERDELFYLDQLTGMADALARPGPERLATEEELNAEFEAEMREHPLRHLLSAMVLPALSRAVTEVTGGEARLRCAQVALAVEEWRVRNGGWPESLDELVPDLFDELPADPFTVAPLRYIVTADTAVVYSVGRDGLDDGGITSSEAQDAAERTGNWEASERWDEPFRLLRPELRGARQRTFREEVLEHHFGPSDLEQVGYTRERLRQLGFTDEDLRSLGFGP